MEIRAEIEKIKTYLKGGRRNVYTLLALLIIPALILSAGYSAVGKYSSIRKAAAAKKTALERFSLIEREYAVKKARLDSLSRKAPLASGDSVISILEETAKGIGINNKVTSLKPLAEKQASGYVEKEAEIKMEGVDLNQLVNFLYRIEANKYLLVTSEFSAKSRFDDPMLLDVRLKISLFART